MKPLAPLLAFAFSVASWSLVLACGGENLPPPAPVPPPPAPPPAPGDLEGAHKTAYARATALTLKKDFDGAIRELSPFDEWTSTSTNSQLAYWIHNELTWLYWGRGDFATALVQTELGAKALDRSALPANDVSSMRLHALWDRAYLLLELKDDQRAERAFQDYEALAKAKDDHDGLAVITAFFHARHKKGAEAMLAAKQVDVEKDSDLQDLYVIALAFDAGGDAAGAVSVRKRICVGNEYLMKPLILAQMQREGFTCPSIK